MSSEVQIASPPTTILLAEDNLINQQVAACIFGMMGDLATLKKWMPELEARFAELEEEMKKGRGQLYVR
jgi:hypothetical protein